jgi:long-chain fatty acid transport protein
VCKPEESPWTLGLGVFVVGGFGINYPGSLTNPILQAPPLAGVGVGPLFTELTVTQVVPTVSLQLTDNLSVGVAPTLTLASLSLDPNIVATPDHPGGTPFVSYPRSAHSPISAGGGVQVGVYYAIPESWQLGASLKTPQWLEKFRFNSMNAAGLPLRVPFSLDFPMIASAGVAYAGFPRWLLAADFRYVDYANTDGFRQGGFGPTGAVQGLGWRSILCVAAGAQYRWTDSLSVRFGYSYNQNPVPDTQGTLSPLATINAAAPVILEHAVYVGATWRVSDNLLVSAAYAHAFENSISGIFRGPVVIVPGSTVRSEASADTFLVGATVQWGCVKK